MRQTQKAVISSIFSLEMHFSFNTNEKKNACFCVTKGRGREPLPPATNGIDTGLNKQLKFRSKIILLLFQYFENLQPHLFP